MKLKHLLSATALSLGVAAPVLAETDALALVQPITDYKLFVTEKTETTRGVSAFLRLGASDGDTSEISGSWQAGLLVEPAFAGRPESAFSAAVTQARLSSAYRNASAAQGLDLARDETVFELAYSDMLTPHLRIQPDLQYVRRPGGDRSVKDALVVGVRFNLAY